MVVLLVESTDDKGRKLCFDKIIIKYFLAFCKDLSRVLSVNEFSKISLQRKILWNQAIPEDFWSE